MSQTVIGVFRSHAEARAARDRLIADGFSASDVTVQSNPADVGMDTGTDMGAGTRTATGDEGEGFMGRVSHFFSNLFGDDDNSHAGHYSEAVRRGSAVLSVQVENAGIATEAQRAMAAAGAVNIEAMAESWRKEGYATFDKTATPYTAEQISAERGKVLPVVQEELEVGKREVDLGTVRVYSRTVETPVNETVELRSQSADIERRAVDRVATEQDLQAFQGGSIEVRETAERPVVSKTAHVVEEVVVGTSTSTTQQTIEDRVRNTVVEVDNGRVGDGQFRDHFQQNYANDGATYDSYEPAYTYGSGLRSDHRYANRRWADVETDAQRDWATRYPATPWEKVKSAVQHGWDSVAR